MQKKNWKKSKTAENGKGGIEMSVWGILVKFDNGEVNINEAYRTYDEAKRVVEKKLSNDVVRLSEFEVRDYENDVTYELKLISVL